MIGVHTILKKRIVIKPGEAFIITGVWEKQIRTFSQYVWKGYDLA